MKLNLGEKRELESISIPASSEGDKVMYPRMSFTTPKAIDMKVGEECCFEVKGKVVGISKTWSGTKYETQIEMHSIETEEEKPKASTRVDKNQESKY